MAGATDLTNIFQGAAAELQSGWLQELARVQVAGTRAMDETTLRSETSEFLSLVTTATHASPEFSANAPAWRPVVTFLSELSASRARAGMASDSTAYFILSLKRPIFQAIRERAGGNADLLAQLNWDATEMIDQLAMQTVAAFQRTREELILRQSEDMLELSTPVVKLWEGILALPMIGTLDSARSQVVMETLLQRIVESGAEIAILDITGVPTVDTLVAQHLLKTVTAIRLMGGDCIISGLRPQIAQTIVQLGVDLVGITTKATLADALALALKRTGQVVVKTGAPA